VVVIALAIVGFVGWKKGWFDGSGGDKRGTVAESNKGAAPGPTDEAEIHYNNGNVVRVKYDPNQKEWTSVGETNMFKQAGGIKKVWIPQGKLLCLKRHHKNKSDPKKEVGRGPVWLPSEYNWDIPLWDDADSTWLRPSTDNCI
jgi:hypothetical protein